MQQQKQQQHNTHTQQKLAKRNCIFRFSVRKMLDKMYQALLCMINCIVHWNLLRGPNLTEKSQSAYHLESRQRQHKRTERMGQCDTFLPMLAD